MKRLRKFFTVSVMVLSVIAMSGLSAATVKASASSGDLIKMAGNTSVYYLGADGKRYVFPNSTTYFSWYSDFSGVVTIPSAELQSYPLGGNVTMRAGTKLVKITTDPSVYAVEPNGALRKIQSEAQAAALYGTNWSKRVVDVPDAFFTNYTVGAVLANGSTPAGSLVKNASGADVYYYDGTNYRVIASESAFNSNRFAWGDVITALSTVSAGGTAISSSETGLVNVAQNGGSGPVVTGSGLMMSLSSMTPASISVPSNGSRVPMAKLNLTAANDGSVSLNSLTVKRIGLSSYSNVDKVWAEKGGEIVASKKSMNSNDESILTFSPALLIPAGQTVSVDLLAGLTGSGAGTVGLSVAAASAVSSTAASVTGSFPVNGNLMSPTSYTVANLAISSTSSSAVTLKVGDENVELGHFTVEFNGTAKDTTITSIMLKNNGTEDLSALMNLYIEYAGNKVSTSYSVDGRYVTFNFASGLPLLKDDGSKLLYLKGDVIAKEQSGAGYSFNFSLNKSTDFVAYEQATGFGVNVYNATSGSTAADNYVIALATVDAGAVSVSKKSTSPTDTTIVKGSDVTVLLANVRTDEAITADGLNLVYSSTATASLTTDQFENVRVYVNGMLVDSFDPATSTGTISEALDSVITFNKGDNSVEVKVKAKSTASASSAFMAKLDSTILTNQNSEYVVSGNAVSGSIGGTATGGIFTVQGAELTTVRNDGYGSGTTIVQGSTDVSLGKFVVKATNDTVKVTSISFDKTSTTTIDVANISDMKLYVDGVQVGNTTDFGSTGVNFSSLNISIAKDATKSIELKGSFDSSASGNFQTTMTVNAIDSRGATVTNGNTTAQTTDFATAAAGTLQVALDGATPVAGLLATKAGVEQEVAKIKFTAIDDSANLTEINLINTPIASTTGEIAPTSVGVSTADSRIASVRLYDGTTLVDSFVPVSGAGKFTITNNSIIIPASGNKTLSVRVVLNDINNDDTATNKDVHLGVTTLKFKSSAGSESTQDALILANNFRLRKTVPTVALQTLPSTLLTAGTVVASKFTVTADANGDVTLGRVVLNYSTSTDVVIATMASNGVRIDGSTNAAASTVSTANSTITVTFATPEVISAGTTKTFEILTNVTATGSNSQSLSTSINSYGSYSTSATASSVLGNFVWSDGASLTAYTYANDYNVSGLPTYTQSMTK